MPFAGKRILLVVSGGISAYKCPDLVRRLRERGAVVRCAMTKAATQFVTPMSLAALTEAGVTTDQFSLTDDFGMSHIRLSRESDLVIVVPATANLIAKMALGIADDIASTLLLANNRPLMVVPAMNVVMWEHPATQANLATLRARGAIQVGPGAGDLACGEVGDGRMADVMEIVAAVEAHFGASGPLAGRRALVTSGPTHEPVDPVRYIANRSSGKQGHAIAGALARLGAEVVLVSGPVAIPDPDGVTVIKVETAREMLRACEAALPADIAVCAAAVADWRVSLPSARKLKKGEAGAPVIALEANPDILATLAAPGPKRPALVVGFAAETENLIENARAKLQRKGCDLVVANDVSPASGTFGGEENTVALIGPDGVEQWPLLAKTVLAERLALRLAERLVKGG